MWDYLQKFGHSSAKSSLRPIESRLSGASLEGLEKIWSKFAGRERQISANLLLDWLVEQKLQNATCQIHTEKENQFGPLCQVVQSDEPIRQTSWHTSPAKHQPQSVDSLRCASFAGPHANLHLHSTESFNLNTLGVFVLTKCNGSFNGSERRRSLVSFGRDNTDWIAGLAWALASLCQALNRYGHLAFMICALCKAESVLPRPLKSAQLSSLAQSTLHTVIAQGDHC